MNTFFYRLVSDSFLSSGGELFHPLLNDKSANLMEAHVYTHNSTNANKSFIRLVAKNLFEIATIFVKFKHKLDND